MENLPILIKRPQPKMGGKWNYIELQFNTDTEFNEATGMIMRIIYHKGATGQCTADDTKGNRWQLDLVHSTYDTVNNVIRIFPWICKII